MNTWTKLRVALAVASVFLSGILTSISHAQDDQKPSSAPQSAPCVLPPLARNPRAVESFTLKAGQHFRTKSGIDFTAPKILKQATTFSISEVSLEKLFSYPGGLKTTRWTNQNARAYKITSSRGVYFGGSSLDIQFFAPSGCTLSKEYALPDSQIRIAPAPTAEEKILEQEQNLEFEKQPLIEAHLNIMEYGGFLKMAPSKFEFNKKFPKNIMWNLSDFQKSGIYIVVTPKYSKTQKPTLFAYLSEKNRIAKFSNGLRVIVPRNTIPKHLQISVTTDNFLDRPYPEYSNRPVNSIYHLNYISGGIRDEGFIFLRFPIPKDIPLERLGVQVHNYYYNLYYLGWSDAQTFIDHKNNELVLRISSKGLVGSYMVVDKDRGSGINKKVSEKPLFWKKNANKAIGKAETGFLHNGLNKTVMGVEIWLEPKNIRFKVPYSLEEIDPATLEIPIPKWAVRYSKVYRLNVAKDSRIATINWRLPVSKNMPESCLQLTKLTYDQEYSWFPVIQYWWAEPRYMVGDVVLGKPFEVTVPWTNPLMGEIFFISRQPYFLIGDHVPDCTALLEGKPTFKP